MNTGWPCVASVLSLDHAPGFAAGCRSGAGYSRISHVNAARPDRAVRRVRQNVSRGLRRRAGLGAARHRRSAPVDDGGRVQRDLRAVPFSARPEHRQPVGGVRIALSRHPRRPRGLCRAGRASRGDRDDPGGVVCALRGNRCLAAHFGRGLLRGGRPAAIGRFPDDDAADQAARSDRSCDPGCGVHRCWAAAAAFAGGFAGGEPGQHRHCLYRAPGAA